MFQNSFIEETVTFFAQRVFLFQACSGVRSLCHGELDLNLERTIDSNRSLRGNILTSGYLEKRSMEKSIKFELIQLYLFKSTSFNPHLTECSCVSYDCKES
jgi:hypothetical protein